MGKVKNLIGQRFGKLTVIRRVGSNKHKQALWLCQCECGNETIISTNNLVSERTKSCGCLSAEQVIKRFTKHGLYKHPLYSIYTSMKARCLSCNSKSYRYYGYRGITICKDWLDDFLNFYNWAISSGYEEGLTLDRIDNNGNYEPSNCRWVSMKVQNNNTNHNCYLTYGGETHTLSEWSNMFDISYHTLYNRINKLKWSIEKALTFPVRRNSKDLPNV